LRGLPRDPVVRDFSLERRGRARPLRGFRAPLRGRHSRRLGRKVSRDGDRRIRPAAPDV
jgi:hypothetical protein